MTSTIRVQAHNDPVMVVATDRAHDGEDNPTEYRTILAILKPEDGDRTFHCTRNRSISCIDLDPTDPRIPVKTPEIS